MDPHFLCAENITPNTKSRPLNFAAAAIEAKVLPSLFQAKIGRNEIEN